MFEYGSGPDGSGILLWSPAQQKIKRTAGLAPDASIILLFFYSFHRIAFRSQFPLLHSRNFGNQAVVRD